MDGGASWTFHQELLKGTNFFTSKSCQELRIIKQHQDDNTLTGIVFVQLNTLKRSRKLPLWTFWG